MSTVLHYLQYGWPNKAPANLSSHSSKSTKLSVHEGCILWGNRVVIPPQGHNAVLQELHKGHPGMCKMKGLAHMHVWWPKIDANIEEAVRLCSTCQVNQSAPAAVPLHPWRWSSHPWTRVHIDYMGPFMGKTFFALINAHSKWIDAVCTNSSSAIAAIEHLCTYSFLTVWYPRNNRFRQRGLPYRRRVSIYHHIKRDKPHNVSTPSPLQQWTC